MEQSERTITKQISTKSCRYLVGEDVYFSRNIIAKQITCINSFTDIMLVQLRVLHKIPVFGPK